MRDSATRAFASPQRAHRLAQETRLLAVGFDQGHPQIPAWRSPAGCRAGRRRCRGRPGCRRRARSGMHRQRIEQVLADHLARVADRGEVVGAVPAIEQARGRPAAAMPGAVSRPSAARPASSSLRSSAAKSGRIHRARISAAAPRQRGAITGLRDEFAQLPVGGRAERGIARDQCQRAVAFARTPACPARTPARGHAPSAPLPWRTTGAGRPRRGRPAACACSQVELRRR